MECKFLSVQNEINYKIPLEYTQCVWKIRQFLSVVYSLIAKVDLYVPVFEIRGPFLLCLSL